MNLSLQDPGTSVQAQVETSHSFQAGFAVDTRNAECTARRCNHTFVLPSNPPSSYDSVSVAAENVVGVGAARTCTEQTISESFINQHQQE